MVPIIPFGMFCTLWATVGGGNKLFRRLKIFTVNLAKCQTFSFFCKTNVSNEMSTHEISSRGCVNGKTPVIFLFVLIVFSS